MMPGQTLLLVADDANTPLGVGTLLSRDGLAVERFSDCQSAAEHLQDLNPDAMFIDCPDDGPPGGGEALIELLDAAEQEGICSLVLFDGDPASIGALSHWAQMASRHASCDELWGRLASIWHTGGLLLRTQREMRDVRRLGDHLNREFEEQCRDMRLASCLQKKFLPRGLPDVQGITFSAVYRPAAWVSGDIYDIARVDEDHISLYIADCVGHGVAASLLTIFVKRVMSTKDITPDGYEILTPAQTLMRLNDALVEADLEMSQYVTATCCLLNVREHKLSVARAGHPYPVMVDPEGGLHLLTTGGPLLGLAAGQLFETEHLTLGPGSKLILHSDGLDEAFQAPPDPDATPRYLEIIEEFADRSAEELTTAFRDRLDGEAGSLRPKDDVTLLALGIPRT